MKKLLVCFPDELRCASALVARADSLPGKTALWVPGGLGSFPAEQTGAEKLVELKSEDDALFSDPLVCAPALAGLFGLDGTPDLVLTLSSPRGDALARQLALILGAACVSAASALWLEGETLAVRRSVYAGNLEADFAVNAPRLCCSLLPGGEDAAPVPSPEVSTRSVSLAPPDFLTEIELVPAAEPDALADARCVVAAGRGAGGRAKLEALAALADTLGGVLGGTRPVICDGKLPPERQLGLSGTRVSPELCLVFGASGAAAFRAGVSESKKIVAVNRDPDAPIFSDCDFGVLADSAEFAAALSNALRGTK